jgi:hypothetical protein
MFKIHAVDNSLSLSSLDLNLLVVFDAILKDRNITAAGRRIGLSQPAMSNALARLRNTFNDPLFVRTGGGMQPTPYAEMLGPPIQRACELVANSLNIDTTFEPLSATCTFNFYVTDIGAAVFLPKLLGTMATWPSGFSPIYGRVSTSSACTSTTSSACCAPTIPARTAASASSSSPACGTPSSPRRAPATRRWCSAHLRGTGCRWH